MITLITGTPGSGKSLRAVYLITLAVDEGRSVYTDIDGIDLDGVQVVDLDHDWRDTPEGSLVVYDEVQRRWPSTGRPGHAEADDIRALETHRHTGHDIIVITQHPTLVHHHVRKLVGQHIHVRRQSNANAVSLFTSPEVFDPKDSNELRNTDKQLWRYPKKLFSAYKSATAHTHKFKIPAKIKVLGIVLFLLVCAVGYAFYSWDMPGTSFADPPRAESEARPAAGRFTPASLPMAHPDYEPESHHVALVEAATAQTLPTISGCLATPHRARCWDNDGQPLDLSRAQVMTLLDDMPRSISVVRGGGSPPGGPGRDPAPAPGAAPAPSPGYPDREPDYQVASAPPSWWSASGGAYSP